ncbi:MFS transporter [Streptacidiphilus sp. ASG 303]|uniref:MFS transporter n=1 Tax=Streptacidiphilus sp. ASG 303 TaxID=2896847 RepID=UPI001E4D2412|nr:MFS transporter [Streptacidiphilus sp. ASG 303]MCD0486121.1 MFS transporter [Streptacidiphilus sp. ASG 303]
MLSTYRRIFAAPGSLAFSTTGLVSRLPISMSGVGIVTMLAQLRGAYGLAGAVSATLALAAAALGPQVSRLVDRHGQRRVALPAVALAAASAVGLLLCARLGAPDWTLFACAAGMGAMPSMGSLVRARWAHLYRSRPALLHTAYSFESVMDEVCFIVGPILAIGLSTSVFPEAGVLLAVVFLTVGTALFTAQRRTEPPVHAAEHRGGGSALRSRGLQVLVLTFVATGAIFGSVEVVTVAFAQERGSTAASSVVLAVYASGSCVAGIVFGALRPTGPMARRFLLGVSVMAVSMLPLLLVGNLVALAAALFVAGLSISPTMVTTMGMVERLVPASRLNEGMTWTITGLAVGVAAGSSVGGWTVDRAGASAGYWVPVVAGSLAALTAFLGSRRLRSAPEQEAERVEDGDRKPQHHP